MAWYDDINIADLGTELAKIAQGRGQGRLAEGTAQQNQDRVGLDAARLNLQSPGMRAGSAVQGDVLAGAQDARVNGPIVHTKGQIPQISGGLRPSLLSPQTRQLGGQMSRDALLSQMKGPAFTPTPLPQSNWLDSLINGGADAAGMIGALGGGKGSGTDFSFTGKQAGDLLKKLFGIGGDGDPRDLGFIGPQDPRDFVGPQDPRDFVGPQDPRDFVPPDPGLPDPWMEYLYGDWGGGGGPDQYNTDPMGGPWPQR